MIDMKEKRNDLIGGLVLIAIGLVALAGRFLDLPATEEFGVYFMAGLGTLFLLAGIITREAGWIIPGGIVSGIGWGIVLIAGPRQLVTGDAEGGVFMLAFAAGWATITLLTAIFSDETHWWALIPAAIMALIGTAVLTNGIFMDILELAGKLWPLALIALGVAILVAASKSRESKEKLS